MARTFALLEAMSELGGTTTLGAALDEVRARGYALDDEEQKIGVRCVTVAVPDVVPPAALSISSPSARMTGALLDRAVPLLRRAATAVGEQGSAD